MKHKVSKAENGGYHVKNEHGHLLGHFNDKSDAHKFVKDNLLDPAAEEPNAEPELE